MRPKFVKKSYCKESSEKDTATISISEDTRPTDEKMPSVSGDAKKLCLTIQCWSCVHPHPHQHHADCDQWPTSPEEECGEGAVNFGKQSKYVYVLFSYRE